MMNILLKEQLRDWIDNRAREVMVLLITEGHRDWHELLEERD